MILFDVCLKPIDDGTSPLNDKTFQTILLIEISVHKLLHCFNGQLRLSALNIILDLLLVDVVDSVFKLFQW